MHFSISVNWFNILTPMKMIMESALEKTPMKMIMKSGLKKTPMMKMMKSGLKKTPMMTKRVLKKTLMMRRVLQKAQKIIMKKESSVL